MASRLLHEVASHAVIEESTQVQLRRSSVRERELSRRTITSCVEMTNAQSFFILSACCRGLPVPANATLSTPVRFTESCGPRLLLGAEPTIRLFRANITATSFHVVDTAVAHDFGTQSNLSFD